MTINERENECIGGGYGGAGYKRDKERAVIVAIGDKHCVRGHQIDDYNVSIDEKVCTLLVI